ncbi:MAG: B12-binding domain-containing radical SAM protein [Acidilobus sp.]
MRREEPEEGVVRKKFRRGMVRVALLYPSTYEVAHSSLVYHRLYFALNDMDNVYLERATLRSSTGAPEAVRGLEGGTPLRSFDFIVTPIHYELDYANLLRALIGSGVQVLSKERGNPKIIVGGPAPTANPEPIADAVDAIIMGDLEPSVRWLESVLNQGAPIEPSEHVYVPAFGKHEVRIGNSPTLGAGDLRRIKAPGSAFTIAVEVARGCPFSCAFCLEGHVTKPFRPRPASEVIDEVVNLYRTYGLRVALIAPTANASPYFKDVLRGLAQVGVPFSTPSLRAELLDDESIDLIARGGQQTLTLAPETSERLRLAVGKLSRDEDFERASRAAASKGLALKLYGLVAVPGETDNDIRSFAELTRRIADSRPRSLELSVNPLVVKPHTPFQWLPMQPEDELNARVRTARQLYVYDRFSFYDPFDALVQASLSLGDRKTLTYIAEVARDGVGRGSWRRAASKGLLRAALKPRRSPLPWSHVRGPVGEEALMERLRAYVEQVPEARRLIPKGLM